MVQFLRKRFIKDYDNVGSSKVRNAHGKMAALFGIVTNLFLFAIKLVAGILSFSISIIADSINNFADMSSSVVTLLGFKLAAKPADKEHPYGHERIEYIAGLIVSVVVMFVGGTLCVTSVKKIINFERETVESYIYYITIGILSLSIIMKLWQSLFNSKVGKIINSVALKATAVDSRNDCITTFAVLVGSIVILFWKDIPFSLDGVLGALVSLFIIYSGFSLIKETADPLIGVKVSEDFVKEVVAKVKGNENVIGVHDVVCHMYGPTRCFMTLHAEVDANADFVEIHEIIDALEHEIKSTYNVELTIHMDPVDTSEYTINLKNKMSEIFKNNFSDLRFHDFRVVKKANTGDSIIFDIEVPYNYHLKNNEIEEVIKTNMNSNDYKCNLIIEFDNIYVGD